MNEATVTALETLRGPVFRFAFALLIFGSLRHVLLALSDTYAAYLTAEHKPEFWRKLRLRIYWLLLPVAALRDGGPASHARAFSYHAILYTLSSIFRVAIILSPLFMIEHVSLWRRATGVGWATMPAGFQDALSIAIIALGIVLFLMRLYSPFLRAVEPVWSFLKPLVLIVPFLTGVFAMNPMWSPFDYHVVMLLHTLSAVIVFILVPFGGVLACMHRPLVEVMPEAAWRYAAATKTSPPAAVPASVG